MEVREDKVSARPLHLLRECPKTFISQFSHDVIQLYFWSKQYNNALPDSGGINDQNALVMEALGVVAEEFQKVQLWQRHNEKTEEDKRQQRDKRERALNRR
jgi:membrane protein involved in colicin uptake